MGFRLTCRGGEAISGVAAAVVGRLARDAGFGDTEAGQLADSAGDAVRGARDASASAEFTVRARHGRLHVDVCPGEAGGEVAVEGRLVRRRAR